MMPNFELSSHLKDMLRERNISEEWLCRTLKLADKSEKQTKDNRILHVVVNQEVIPYRVVTAFFDRRLRKRK